MSFSSFIRSFIRELDKEFPDMDIDVDFWDDIYDDSDLNFWNQVPIDPITYLDEHTFCIKNDTEDTCSICLENYKKGEEQLSLLCNHQYHKKCITEWFKIKSTCPCCRVDTKNLSICR